MFVIDKLLVISILNIVYIFNMYKSISYETIYPSTFPSYIEFFPA